MSDRKKKNSLFRAKNIEKIESPEVLDQYLKVTSPGIWMILISVIVLLIGLCVWGVLGSIDAKTDVAVVKENNSVYCLVPESAMKAVLANPTVNVDGEDLELKPDSLEATTISDDTNVYILLAGNLSAGDVVYKVLVDGDIEEDVCTGSIVTERLKPMSLILN